MASVQLDRPRLTALEALPLFALRLLSFLLTLPPPDALTEPGGQADSRSTFDMMHACGHCCIGGSFDAFQPVLRVCEARPASVDVGAGASRFQHVCFIVFLLIHLLELRLSIYPSLVSIFLHWLAAVDLRLIVPTSLGCSYTVGSSISLGPHLLLTIIQSNHST